MSDAMLICPLCGDTFTHLDEYAEHGRAAHGIQAVSVERPAVERPRVPSFESIAHLAPRPQERTIMSKLQRFFLVVGAVLSAAAPIVKAALSGGFKAGVLAVLVDPHVVGGLLLALVAVVFLVLDFRKVRIPAARREQIRVALAKYLPDAQAYVARTKTPWDNVALDVLQKVAKELTQLGDGEVPTAAELQFAEAQIKRAAP